MCQRHDIRWSYFSRKFTVSQGMFVRRREGGGKIPGVGSSQWAQVIAQSQISARNDFPKHNFGYRGNMWNTMSWLLGKICRSKYGPETKCTWYSHRIKNQSHNKPAQNRELILLYSTISPWNRQSLVNIAWHFQHLTSALIKTYILTSPPGCRVPKFCNSYNFFQNSNFHNHIYIQNEKCIKMSANKPIVLVQWFLRWPLKFWENSFGISTFPNTYL